MNKVAVLTSLSTSEKKHDKLVKEIIDYAADKGYIVVEVVVEETRPGTDKVKEKAGMSRILELAAASKINKVILPDHLGLRRKPSESLKALEELHKLKVSVLIKCIDLWMESSREKMYRRGDSNGCALINANIETLTPDGKLSYVGVTLNSILMQRDEALLEHIESVKSGMAEAKQQGKHTGRPRGTIKDKANFLKEYDEVVKCLQAGQTVRKTAILCGVSTTTVQKVKNFLESK